MNTLETLIEAISKKQQISFEYKKEGKVQGVRFGDPYAVFIFTAKNTRIQSTKVHIVQTGGVSDTIGKDEYGVFRMFNIEDLNNVVILSDRKPFEPFHKDYKPESEFYKDVIAKV